MAAVARRRGARLRLRLTAWPRVGKPRQQQLQAEVPWRRGTMPQTALADVFGGVASGLEPRVDRRAAAIQEANEDEYIQLPPAARSLPETTTMSYRVLARRWRPKNFSSMVGQEHVVRALRNALEQNRLHHACLFTGTRGVGKTTFARIIAKCLNCARGVTADPCGECEACCGIDAGRFIDLLEVDAASRARVDETRDLMDSVPYAPTVGRCKVYLIDEVHMFSNHSFNALLKVLEEPPDHVKFLFATTEPKRIPVTVLSRCLQFNLRRLAPEQIATQIEIILKSEEVQFDAQAPRLLATAAQGSMRDALSLLDQAISDGGGELREARLKAMLGTVEQADVEGLLEAVISGDGPALLAECDRVADLQTNPAEVLSTMLTLLQRVAVCQAAGSVGTLQATPGSVRDFAARVSTAEVQLFYQIALTGRRDLSLCPDPHAGLEMCMVRMLAFRPGEEATTKTVAAANARACRNPAPAVRTNDNQVTPASTATGLTTVDGGVDPASSTATASVESPPDVTESRLDVWWRELVGQLQVSNGTRQLALQCAPQERTETRLVLAIDGAGQVLLSDARKQRLQEALDQALDPSLKLEFSTQRPGRPVPAERNHQLALRYLKEDTVVRQLQTQYGASIDPNSVRLVEI